MLHATLRLARLTALPNRRAAIDTLLAARDPAPQVALVTPARFLSPRKLARPNEAIDGLLEVFAAAHRLARARGLTVGLSTPRTIAGTPALYLSHHTVDDAKTRALREAGTLVRHVKAADLPGRTVFDPLGFSGWSSMAEKTVDDLDLGTIDLARAAQVRAAMRDDAIGNNTSKYAQAAGFVPEGPFVFVALQTLGDMVQRKARVPMLEMLRMVIARFEGTGLRVVVKRHPRCRNRQVMRALAQASSAGHVVLSTASIHALMDRAQALFTVNSGVGSEAMLHGLPVYCFGASDYAPMAHQVASQDDLARLTNPIRHRLLPDALDRFHYHYREVFQVDRSRRLEPVLTALLDQALQDQPGRG